MAKDGVSSWTLEASIDGLKVSHLANFWPEGNVRDAAMSMLSHITLEHVGLMYRFGAGDGEGVSDLVFDGVLKLGGLRFFFDFHSNSKEGWVFGAKTLLESKPGDGMPDGAPIVETMLRELLGEGNIPDIPGEVLKVPVGGPGSKGEFLSFRCVLAKDQGKPEQSEESNHASILICTLSIRISAISLTLVQWRDTSWLKDVPSKRVVKVALNEVGPVKAPPVGEFNQPFEQLVYMWVSDQATAKAKPKMLAERDRRLPASPRPSS